MDEEEQANEGEFYCGICKVFIPTHILYGQHYSVKHHSIIGRESSHIIVRAHRNGKTKKNMYLEIDRCPEELEDRVFRCSCDLRRKYKYFDFI